MVVREVHALRENIRWDLAVQWTLLLLPSSRQ
jgi:hypothetical protein